MDQRQHPDIFTPAEALAYLHLPENEERTLETLREKHGLNGKPIGRTYFYHRRDLDAVAARIFGVAEAVGVRKNGRER